MEALLNDPMIQAGVAPFVAALVAAVALQRTRLAWLGISLAIATAVALTTGISFETLSASRRVLLLVLLVPFAAIALDRVVDRGAWVVAAIAGVSGLATLWVFQTVLVQREAADAVALGGGVAVFVALMVALMLRLRDDGAAAGGAGVALGLSAGAAAFMSASIGNLMNGIALAAGAGAMLAFQFVTRRPLVPGLVGTWSIGLAVALFAAATFVLAQLPWYALPLLLLVPAAAALPVWRDPSPRTRLVKSTLAPLAISSVTVLAAWLATRFTGS